MQSYQKNWIETLRRDLGIEVTLFKCTEDIVKDDTGSLDSLYFIYIL